MSKEKPAKMPLVKEKPIQAPKTNNIIETYNNSNGNWVKSIVTVEPNKNGGFEVKDIEGPHKGYEFSYYLKDDDWRWPLNKDWQEDYRKMLKTIKSCDSYVSPFHTNKETYYDVQYMEEDGFWETYDAVGNASKYEDVLKIFQEAITTDRSDNFCPENKTILRYRLVKVTQEIVQEVEFKTQGA